MDAAPAKGARSVPLKSEFIFETAPFPSCHASTIEETTDGLIAAWFGGTAEGNADVGIWTSRYAGGHWSPPVEVATGAKSDGQCLPCWNPVLFQPQTGPLMLFYKVGPSPDTWWGLLKTSNDGGETWSPPQRLPDGILGPIKNKPVQLPDGEILCPSSTEDDGWCVHLERTRDLGRTWEVIGPLNERGEFDAIQPTILPYGAQRMQMLCRTQQGVIAEAWSADDGRTWSKIVATVLPNPNSGIDAVTLRDGRALLVYNHTAQGRSPLNVAVSTDGKTWRMVLALEDMPGEYSYPAVVQTADGLVHTIYTWHRARIKHVVVDPAKLVP